MVYNKGGKSLITIILTIKPYMSLFEKQEFFRILVLKKKEKKRDLKHNYIGALMAAYSILLIAYYCVITSHNQPPDKIK